MAGLPIQRGSETAAAITVGDGAPDDIKDIVESLVAAAAVDPHTLRRALRNGTVLASPARIIAEAELGDPDKRRMGALALLARVFKSHADRWIEYDDATNEAIRAGVRDVDPDTARAWRIDTYLGRVGLALDGQIAETPPPPNPAGTFDQVA